VARSSTDHQPAGRPWRPRTRGPARWAPAASTLLAVVGVIAVTLWQLHPSLLLSNTTTTGGDTGAHYMMPAFFNTNLFPHLTGWDPAWYDGYPIYTFYFVLPDVLVALASHLIGYNVAFKLGTIAGSVLLPVAAWAMGRLFRLPPPLPAILAAATLPFLFDNTFQIYGGNLFSTLAGEYAYSLSVALALLFLGLFARGIRSGRHRGWAAVVLALCILAHIVPAVFALVGAGLLIVFELLPERLRFRDDLRSPGTPSLRPPGGDGALGRRRACWWGLSTVAIGLLLSGWWLVPFGVRQPYATTMNYANVTTYVSILFPKADLWALVLAGLAVLVALLLRSRFGLLVSALGGLSALGLIVDPQGALYNVRLLPLWFLCVYLMAGWVFGVIVIAVARWGRRERLARWVFAVGDPGDDWEVGTDDPSWDQRRSVAAADGAAHPPVPLDPSGAVAAGGVVSSPVAVEPSASAHRFLVDPDPVDRSGAAVAAREGMGDDGAHVLSATGAGSTRWSDQDAADLPPRPRAPLWAPGAVGGPILALVCVLVVVATPFVSSFAGALPDIGITPGANQVSAWATWNYTGYEGKPDYPEYRAVMQLMGHVGREYGCGRAMWEYTADENRFGTPEALMLLPYWTNGCVDSMEGLLFESSATTPFHFLNQAELSVAPSEAVVGLPYGPLDVALGIQHLQLLGVRYFMAFSPQVQQAAAADPSLRLVAHTGPWHTDFDGENLSTTWDVYVVQHSALVTPLTHQPAVLTGVGPSQSSWLGTVGPLGQDVNGPSVAWYDNPSRWAVELTAGGLPGWPRVTASGSRHPPSVRVPVTTVSRVRQTADSVSFHVSRVGTPVLVKVSYFPNWQATGARGPWRATPNLMVVVPTAHDVTLTYGTTRANDLGVACTAAGVLALIALGALAMVRTRRRAGAGRPAGTGDR
jgi:hypothetical protein